MDKSIPQQAYELFKCWSSDRKRTFLLSFLTRAFIEAEPETEAQISAHVAIQCMAAWDFDEAFKCGVLAINNPNSFWLVHMLEYVVAYETSNKS